MANKPKVLGQSAQYTTILIHQSCDIHRQNSFQATFLLEWNQTCFCLTSTNFFFFFFFGEYFGNFHVQLYSQCNVFKTKTITKKIEMGRGQNEFCFSKGDKNSGFFVFVFHFREFP